MTGYFKWETWWNMLKAWCFLSGVLGLNHAHRRKHNHANSRRTEYMKTTIFMLHTETVRHSKWLCDLETTLDLSTDSLILAALPIPAYPTIHMCTGTASSSQWQGREEMVLEGCQAGSSEWPYMVKSAVSRTERQQWQRQRQPGIIEVLEHRLTRVWGKTLHIKHVQCIFVFGEGAQLS